MDEQELAERFPDQYSPEKCQEICITTHINRVPMFRENSAVYPTEGDSVKI